MNHFAVDGDLMAQLPSTAPLILTEVFVNVHRRLGGQITAQSHASLDRAIQQAGEMNRGGAGTRCIARVRVPLVCTEGQFDV